jgi:hypothetical protein
MPLKYSVAAKLLRVFNINPSWLADGNGRISIGVNIPTLKESDIPKEALFSEVFANYLKHIVSKQIAAIQSSPAYKYGEHLYSSDPSGRLAAEELLITEIRSWIGTVRGANLNKLVNNIRFAALGLLDESGIDAEPAATVKHRLAEMEKARARLEKRRTYLTEAASDDRTAEVKLLLPNLLKRLNEHTSEPGKKSELAEFLGAPLASVSRWLSGDREPGGEVTLKMLHWVQLQERK